MLKKTTITTSMVSLISNTQYAKTLLKAGELTRLRKSVFHSATFSKISTLLKCLEIIFFNRPNYKVIVRTEAPCLYLL